MSLPPQAYLRMTASSTGVLTHSADAVILQQDLDRLQKWEADWLMQFKPDKCVVMRITNRRGRRIDSDYTIHGTVLREISSAKYLGVNIDSKLTWNAHIANVTKKANNILAFLQRNINTCPANIKETCYKTFVRPSVKYASCVWDPPTAKNISAVKMVQRHAASFVTGEYRYTSSVSALIKTIGWHSLAHRRAMSRVTILCRVTHGLVDMDPSRTSYTGES